MNVFYLQEQYYGVVKWIGNLPQTDLLNTEITKTNEFSNKTMIAGIELVSEVLKIYISVYGKFPILEVYWSAIFSGWK